MPQKTLMSWSSGKDSAWALYTLQQNPDYEVVGLFCTVNKEYDRVAMHGVRVELLRQQASSIGLPLTLIEIPSPCTNAEYEAIMGGFVEQVKKDNIACFAFGDLFLEDIRHYREANLKGTGITPVFPIWGMPTEALSREMVQGGLKAVITCVDPKQASADYAGALFDGKLLDALPDSIDPCGERGEFHSFVYDGPMFKEPVAITLGEVVTRDGFVFADVLPGVSGSSKPD